MSLLFAALSPPPLSLAPATSHCARDALKILCTPRLAFPSPPSTVADNVLRPEEMRDRHQDLCRRGAHGAGRSLIICSARMTGGFILDLITGHFANPGQRRALKDRVELTK